MATSVEAAVEVCMLAGLDKHHAPSVVALVEQVSGELAFHRSYIAKQPNAAERRDLRRRLSQARDSLKRAETLLHNDPEFYNDALRLHAAPLLTDLLSFPMMDHIYGEGYGYSQVSEREVDPVAFGDRPFNAVRAVERQRRRAAGYIAETQGLAVILVTLQRTSKALDLTHRLTANSAGRPIDVERDHVIVQAAELMREITQQPDREPLQATEQLVALAQGVLDLLDFDEDEHLELRVARCVGKHNEQALKRHEKAEAAAALATQQKASQRDEAT